MATLVRGGNSPRLRRAADVTLPRNQLLPTQVMIETDHDICNPAGLTAIERITAAIMAIGGVRAWCVGESSQRNGVQAGCLDSIGGEFR